jgi:hypothetical protein
MGIFGGLFGPKACRGCVNACKGKAPAEGACPDYTGEEQEPETIDLSRRKFLKGAAVAGAVAGAAAILPKGKAEAVQPEPPAPERDPVQEDAFEASGHPADPWQSMGVEASTYAYVAMSGSTYHGARGMHYPVRFTNR